ncbi:hypothetical protein A2331_00195 [Candidatus Falkowbacteria bacterium RIFOXYB2_FULL_34_18]|uniref:Ferredoxin n=1 Tax=Candidatus Falkowbacteria bacterium RIFOXYD2_FULL_34_120 TaxID=1798007 RepID=A0A1F5TS59_9BACT|nr:MAG: hypothetical protein A2331_00195 [Candidatus Falkowbacteria bacterium RIFOXYB2_FULL_34_18]OGF29756.1 MAG: hypothetical protein A2500_01155 [Candidatus Falkowbacteria bacterium RIFOXYC12_FULL_34_55]OGF37515.1 MAG: hypothetical protein A2466_00755 [Candidatus Falkowbacteria bacterium RIFOXYC2_FULL_34_220]OGF39225.1 MAG: hypothetical protein A2515_01265 [Candidatus Falkowbacteria bacterium RIFOXYD12_FULL_34_57]OGF41792.1 MAG: hypothetical protein A2531_05925 [Candidatus Falkowbacteria bact
MIKVDYNKCCWKDGKCASCDCEENNCGGCVEVCPVNAITRDKQVEINAGECLECGACAAVCPHQAITIE